MSIDSHISSFISFNHCPSKKPSTLSTSSPFFPPILNPFSCSQPFSAATVSYQSSSASDELQIAQSLHIPCQYCPF